MKLPFTLLLLATLIFSNAIFAQPANAEAEQLKLQLNNFAAAYVSLPAHKDPEKVLKYFAQEVSTTIFYFNVSGSTRQFTDDYSGFEAYLKKIVASPSIAIKYEITDIYLSKVSGSNGVTVFAVTYENKEEDGVWVKGQETVSMAWEKKNDQWKVVHYSILGSEDEKLKGTCLCELFVTESSDGEVVAKTTMPQGKSYSTKFDNFEFKTENGVQTIKVGGDFTFRRLASGSVVQVMPTGEKEIGISNTKRETVLLIIENALYKENCTQLKTK